MCSSDLNIYAFVRSKAPLNYGGYSDAQVDAWLDEARTMNDPAGRKAVYARVADRILDDRPLLYLLHRSWFIAHTARLEGLRLLPDGLIRVTGLTLK